MIKGKNISALLSLGMLIAASLFLSAPARAEISSQGAQDFVKSVTDRTLDVLRDKSLSPAKQDKQFSQIVRESLAFKKVGMWALGRYAKTATPAQIQEYLEILDEYIVRVYLSRLRSLSNEKILVTGTQSVGNDIIVLSRVEFPATGRPPVNINWRLVYENGAYKIFDVQALGIWMAQEQRAAFASVISKNNNDVGALIKVLRTKITAPEASVNAANDVKKSAQ